MAAAVVVILIVAIIAFVLVKKRGKSKAAVNPVTNNTRAVSTVPNVGQTNPIPVTDADNSQPA